MRKWLRFSVFVVWVGVVCGCTPSEPEQVARSTGDDSISNSSDPSDAETENVRKADNGESFAPNANPRSDNSPTELEGQPEPSATSNPPVTSSPSAPSNSAETMLPPDKRTPAKADRGDSARPDPDPDPDAYRGSSMPEVLPPVVPSGKLGTDIGDTIPPVKGKDVEGARFQLSDYEGKVVMIDFWGDW